MTQAALQPEAVSAPARTDSIFSLLRGTTTWPGSAPGSAEASLPRPAVNSITTCPGAGLGTVTDATSAAGSRRRSATTCFASLPAGASRSRYAG